jgi:molybdenum cofactor biosynthesis protein B
MTTGAAEQHRRAAPASVRCFILTVSDTRTAATDTSGDAIATLLAAAGHLVVGRTILKDEPALVRRVIEEQLNADRTTGAQVVITTGGTGISARDQTFEAVTALLEKRLDGFGELFRMLSFEEIGSAAMMSRATAGTAGRTAIFALPGSPAAVRLAMTRLILPELGHIAQQVSR